MCFFIEEEKVKFDDEFCDEDGKLLLLYIEYKGEVWRVGKLFFLLLLGEGRCIDVY